MRLRSYRSWKILLLVVIPLALLTYLGGNFAYPVRGAYSDLAISHLPNAEFLRQSLLAGELPLWSPLLFAGYPFAANPLSALHYPPGWLALFFPLPFGFNLVTALHLLAAGIGMYFFLRNEGLGEWPALGAAVVFQAMPKILSHYAAGHLSLVYAVCLTPWFLWAEQIRQRNFTGWRNLRTIGPGILLGLIALADIRWAPYAAVLWLAYAVRGFNSARQNGGGRIIAWAGGMAVQGIVLVTLSASLWLPLLEYIPLTTRTLMTPAERTGISLPPGNLLGLFIPSLGGYAEWESYSGALPWLFLIFTLAVPDLRRKVWFWLAAWLLSLLAAMGSFIPGYEALSNLPGFSLLRVPARSLFITGFSFAVLTGFALDYLLHNKVEQRPEPIFFMVPFAAFPLLVAGGMGIYLGGYFQPFLWAGIAILIFGALILAVERRWLPVQISLGLMVILMLLELGGMGGLVMRVKDRGEILGAQQDLLAAIAPQGGQLYRVYSPSFSLPQTVTTAAGIGLVDGIDPMQLSAYVHFFSRATGIPVDDYSVTLPPFPNGSPEMDNAGYSPNAELLGVLNTKYILSAFPVNAEGFRFTRQVGQTFVYENLDYRDRVWVETEDESVLEDAKIMEYRANQVVIRAKGPGRLVVSDVMYPGWRVMIDGVAGEIQTDRGVFRSILLPPGEHEVLFTFRPLTVFLGWGISILAWIYVLVFAVYKTKRES